MKRHRLLASIVCACALAASPAAGQGNGPAPMVYALVNPPSQFEWGCFGPCACPVFVQSPIVGKFVLSFSHADPLFTYYDVSDVRWTIHSATGPVTITGAGSYRRGGEVALTEQLSLELSFDQGPARLFDSGLKPVGAQFPEIRTDVSLHGEFCMDSVLRVDAKAIGPVSVDGSPRGLALVIGPNPSAGTAEAVFTLPRDETVDLGVFDLTGRRVRALVTHEPLPAGTHARTWDGTRDSGGKAAPGIYLVRLETPSQRLTRTAVRVR
jgi:hypothetical protein